MCEMFTRVYPGGHCYYSTTYDYCDEARRRPDRTLCVGCENHTWEEEGARCPIHTGET